MPPAGTSGTAEGRLAEIVQSGRLRGWPVPLSRDPVICFSELSTAALRGQLSNCFTGRGPYAPWGLIFNKSALISAGARPVWYMDDAELSATDTLPTPMRDRRVRYTPVGSGIDWTHEREWRICFGTAANAYLALSSSLLAGVLVGTGKWLPATLPNTHPLHLAHRYLWTGAGIQFNGRLHPGGYVVGPTEWIVKKQIDWSGEEPFTVLDPEETSEPPDDYYDSDDWP